VLGFLHEGIVKKQALFLSVEAWQHLDGMSTLRATPSGVHKIDNSYINIRFLNLISESVVLLYQKET
jgi:hypothetical protein